MSDLTALLIFFLSSHLLSGFLCISCPFSCVAHTFVHSFFHCVHYVMYILSFWWFLHAPYILLFRCMLSALYICHHSYMLYIRVHIIPLVCAICPVNVIALMWAASSIQYSENNVMHFLFSLLRIKDLYMFQALVAHSQDSLHKRHLVCCTCVLCQLAATGLKFVVQPADITRMQHTKCCLCGTSWGWASNAWNM
jgi:hypothetical protein